MVKCKPHPQLESEYSPDGEKDKKVIGFISLILIASLVAALFRVEVLTGGTVERVSVLAVIFLVISVIAALLGFGGVAAATGWTAQLLFFGFIVLFIVWIIFGRKLWL